MSAGGAPNDSGDADNDGGKKTAQDYGWDLPTDINYAEAASKNPVQPFYHTTGKYEYNGDVGDLGPEASAPFLGFMLSCIMLHHY